MKDAGKDIYDIKKAEEVLQESYMMIPDSKNRFHKSLDDLLAFVNENSEDPAIARTEELEKALKVLADNERKT